MALIFLLVILAGCISQKTVESKINELLPDEIDTFARHYITIVREGRLDEAESLLNEEIVTPETGSLLRMVSSMLNPGRVESTEIINVFFTKMFSEEKTRFNLEYYVQYDLDESALNKESQVVMKSGQDSHLRLETNTMQPEKAKIHQIVSIAIVQTPAGMSILGFNVQTIPKSVKELNKFGAQNLDISRQGFLTFWIAAPLFSLYVAVLCFRSKVKRKLLWLIFIIIGIGKLTLNWTTGQLTSQPLSIQLLSASYFRPGLYGPWLFSVSWPLGALIFFVRRKKLASPPMRSENNPETAHDKGAVGGREIGKQQDLDFGP